MCVRMRALSLPILAVMALAVTLNVAYAQPGPPNNLQVGYVIVTPDPSTATGLAVFETFGEVRAAGALQAGVLPADMVKNAMLFVTTSSRLSRNLGVAIANPNPTTDAGVLFTLKNSDGSVAATQTITVKATTQTAQFVTQLFAGKLPPTGDFNGTLTISSTLEVAMVGLRFRGVNFSTIPVTPLGTAFPVPAISTTPPIGGTGAVILPQFADGGGWASEIVLTNTGTTPLKARVDIFDQAGKPLIVTLNGTTASSFTIPTVPAGGVVVLAPVKHHGDDDDF